MSNPNTRKSCGVPKCKNTTTNSPEKLFFIVPKDVKMRKKWIKAMKRLDPFGDKSTVYCCQDHFDIENDMENYTKYKLVGGRIKLKQGIVPHKFKCLQEKEDKPQRSAVQKRQPNSNEDSLQADDGNEIKVFCPKCNAEISHTAEGIQEDQTKIIIAKVYQYFEQEYEELKKSFDGLEQTPLSKFRQRTALATGVSETTVVEILQEEARRNAEEREEPSPNESRARKRLRQTDSSSEEDSDSNEDGDDELSSAAHEVETLVVKEEPADEPPESDKLRLLDDGDIKLEQIDSEEGFS